MANWHTIQSSFFSGELSPEFAAQVGTDLTRTGVEEGLNAMILRSGAAVKAPGTVFISELGAAASFEKSRIWGFMDHDSNDWLLATFTHDTAYVSEGLNTYNLPNGVGWSVSLEQSEQTLGNIEFDSIASGPNPYQSPAVSDDNFYNATLTNWTRYPFYDGRNDGLTAPSTAYPYRSKYDMHTLQKPSAHQRGIDVKWEVNLLDVQPGGSASFVDIYYSGAPTGDVFTELRARLTSGAPVTALNGYDTTVTGDVVDPNIRQTVTLPLTLDSIDELRLRLQLADNADTVKTELLNSKYVQYILAGNLSNLVRLRLRVTTGSYDGTVIIDDEADSLTIPRYPALETVERTYDVSGAGLSPGDTVYLHVGLVLADVASLFAGDVDAVDARVRLTNVQMFATGGGGSLNVGTAPLAPYTADQVNALHFLQSPFDDKELTLWHPEQYPRMLYFGGTPLQWRVDQFPVANAPAEWDTANYPGAATAFQSRLVCTGAPRNPESVFASKVGEWRDFDLNPVSPTDADGVAFTPTARGENTWVAGAQQLMFGSTEADYVVQSAGGVLTFSDVGVVKQTAYGSNRMPQKTALGRAIALATTGGRALRLLEYSDNASGFVGRDVSSHAEQILRPGLKRMIVTNDPTVTFWGLRNDGKLAIMNMEPDREFPAWTLLDFAGGEVLDITKVLTPDGGDVVLLLMKRTTTDGDRVYLEGLPNLRDRSQWRYLHSALTKLVTPGNPQVAGFDHLKGLTVSVFVDGVYTGEQQVSTSGELTVSDTSAVSVTAGLGYNFKLRTFPEGSIDPTIGGLADKKRYSTIGVRMLDSGPPVVNGQRAPGRTPTMLMDSSPEFSGVSDHEVTNRGWSSQANITIEEPDPFPVTVLGIYGKLVNNRV